MAHRRVPLEKRKYYKYDSQRSGFTHMRTELIRDDKWLVHPDERDEPAPYRHYIGGEGDSSTGEIRSNRTVLPQTEGWFRGSGWFNNWFGTIFDVTY